MFTGTTGKGEEVGESAQWPGMMWLEAEEKWLEEGADGGDGGERTRRAVRRELFVVSPLLLPAPLLVALDVNHM